MFFIIQVDNVVGHQSLIRIMRQWLLGLHPSLAELYHGSMMFCSLSCRQSLRKMVSPNISVIQFDNVNSDFPFFSTLVMFRWGQSKLYWNRGSAVMLMPCELNCCCVSAYQQQISLCLASCFEYRSLNLTYLHLGSYQSHWIPVIDQNNALWLLRFLPSPSSSPISTVIFLHVLLLLVALIF